MWRFFRVGLLTVLIGLLTLAPNQSFAAPEFDTYIVILQPGADRAEVARSLGQSGGRIQYEYSAVFSGFAISLPAPAALALVQNPNVLSVELDAEVTTFDTQNPAPSWGLDRIDQADLPLSLTFDYPTTGNGSGVHAYIVDTGVLSTHNEFTDRIVSGFSAIKDRRGTTDCNGHGTHVAGTVAGTIYGVAKRSTVVPVRVLDCRGSGTISGVIAGLDWVARNHTTSPAVVNMSLGGGANTSLDEAVRGVVADGVTVVVAAGNSNLDACTSSPSRVVEAVTVGATDKFDARAPWSNYGSCLDLFAPGVDIKSAWYTSKTATNTISGTSMASPHVAGVAAVLLSKTTTLTPAAVADLLKSTATPAVVWFVGTNSPNLLLYSNPAG